MDSGIFLELWGGVIVVLLGILGTYFWLRSAVSSKERPIILKQTVFCWVMVLVLVLGVECIPRPFGFLLWLPCGILVVVMVLRWNRQREEVRNEARRRRDEAFLRGETTGENHEEMK